MNSLNKRKQFINNRAFSYETIKTEEDPSQKENASFSLLPFTLSQDSEAKELVKEQAPEFHSVMSSQNSFRSYQKPPDFNSHYEIAAASPYLSLDDYFRPHSTQQPSSLESVAATQALIKIAAASTFDPFLNVNSKAMSTDTSNQSTFAFKAALPETKVCTCPCYCGARPNVKTEIHSSKSPEMARTPVTPVKDDKKGTKQNVSRNIPGLIFGRVKARCRKCLRMDEGDLSDDEENRVEYITQVWKEERLDENAKKHFFAFIDVSNVIKNKTWSSVEENCNLDKKSALVVLRCVEGFLSDKGHKDFENWIESGTKMSTDVKNALREKKADFLKDFKKIYAKLSKSYTVRG